MSLVKIAESTYYDGGSFPVDSFALDDHSDDHSLEVVAPLDNCAHGDDGSDLTQEEVIHVDEITPDFVFKLPIVPGGDYQDELEDPSEIEVSDEEVEVENDPWKWTVGDFVQWLQSKMQKIP